MEPRRKGEVREDERPMEGHFWALEGRWNCGRTKFCLRFVSACALDKMAWPAIASGSAACATQAEACASMSAPACAACGDKEDGPLCNLYSVTKGQQAIRELARAMRNRTGNLPPLYAIFPDYSAPIVRNQPEGRELMMARWGMPSPVFALKGKTSDPGVANVRNVKSPHWRRWREPLRGALDEFFRE
jgi:hypothetical protein